MSSNEHPSQQDANTRPIDIPGGSNATRQPGVQSPRMPAAYGTSSYGTAPYGTAGATAAPYGSVSPTQKVEGRRLVIGEGITMSGEIEACDTLVVEGTIEAALKGASVLEVAESGTFYGTVEINECTIAGRFEGDLTVNGRLTVKASGSVTGTIAYKELAVDSGATLDGKITPLLAKSAKKSEKPKEGKSGGKLRPDSRGEEGVELPFAGSSAAAAE